MPQSEMALLRFLDFTYYYVRHRAADNFQMTSLICNDPTVTGYSVCWARNLAIVHAHRRDEDLSFYNDADAQFNVPLWIYMPIDPGEILSEIWGRRGKREEHMGLMVSMARKLM